MGRSVLRKSIDPPVRRQRRRKRDAKYVDGVGGTGSGLSGLSRLVGLGSVVSYPSVVGSRAPAENSFNAFSARQNAPRCSVFTARRKASFESAVYATANPSITLRCCVKTRERGGIRSSPADSPVSLVFLCQEWLMETTPSR